MYNISWPEANSAGLFFPLLLKLLKGLGANFFLFASKYFTFYDCRSHLPPGDSENGYNGIRVTGAGLVPITCMVHVEPK
jgi:hypothetical protein